MAFFLKYCNAVFLEDIRKLKRLSRMKAENMKEFKVKFSEVFLGKIMRVLLFVELRGFLGLRRLG